MSKRIFLILFLGFSSLVTSKANDISIISFGDFDDTIYIDLAETIDGDTLKVDFSVRSFVDIQSLQFSIQYSEGLSYISLDDGEIEGEFNPGLDHAIAYTWFDFLGNPLTLDDGEIIFSLSLLIENTDRGTVGITGTPTAIEITNSSDEQVFLGTDEMEFLFNGNRLLLDVFADSDNNCIFNEGEFHLSDWIVNVESAEYSVKLKTDFNGSYAKYLPPGEYTVQLVAKNNLWQACDMQSFTFVEGENIEYPLQLGAKALASCSQAEISAEVPLLRRCFDNTYYFQYCNYGTVAMESSDVVISVDENLSYVSSTIEPSQITDQSVSFVGGSLNIGECKTFEIVFALECEGTILGQTHCLEAAIGPQMDCVTNEAWSGANVEVDVTCEGDEVKFVVRNTGTGAMSAAKSFIVIEDDVMMPQFEDDYEIPEKDSIIRVFPANGSTYRLIAQQEDFHPNPNMPTAAVEGCGTNEEGGISIGYFTQFSDDDHAPFIDVVCRENIGAYDPNDKQGFPKGYGDEAFIYDDTDLEYLIRFQNTGTDTAFLVQVTDVIIGEFNVDNIQVGPASHPYTWEILGLDTIVFTFENIMLPDSAVDLNASNGFIKYKIQQNEGNADGIKLTNEADIFFDFNEAVHTNMTEHTIGSAFVVSDIFENGGKSEDFFKIYPNPTLDGLWIENIHIDEVLEFQLYSSEGRLLQKQSLRDHLTFIPKSTLQSGVNFYTINAVSGSFYSGKILVLK